MESLLLQLEQSQWWSVTDMRARQHERLTHLLRHAYDTVPFMRDRLDAAGVRITNPVSAERWQQIPLLTRRDIQEAGESLVSSVVADAPDRTRRIVTSGSTGEPVSVLQSDRVRHFWCAFTIRDHLWHRRDCRQKFAAIRSTHGDAGRPPHGTVKPNWGAATRGVFVTGPGAILSVDAGIKVQAEWLCRQDPAYLLSYPSNLNSLAEFFKEQGRQPLNLRQVLTIGEVLTPSQRSTIGEGLGALVTDAYTSQEVGYIALQCAEQLQYHIQSENVYVEVIDDAGQSCGPGEVGRVVVTSLHNFATPLIRYVLGDYVEVGETCPCGRGLPVIRQIMGRQRNMLILPDGTRRWPAIGEGRDLEQLPRFHQVQLIQRSLQLVEVLIVAPRPLHAQEEVGAKKYLQGVLGHPFDIKFSYVDSIPRSAGGKFEDFRSEVAVSA